MKGFLNARVYLQNVGIVKTNIGFEDGKIAYIGNLNQNIENICDVGDALVCPGFIDEHMHGAGGADAMDGNIKSLSVIAETVAKEGTVGFLATTMTQSPENITNALKAVKDYRNGKHSGAEILGVHLEGPFISLKHVGAQPKEYVAAPSVETFKKYNEACGNAIKILTVAPEVEGAERLIEYCKSEGIVVSIGHTDAKYNDVLNAVSWGASNITHTYNAQTGLHHREAGVVGAAMLLDELNCEAICDTIHVSVPAIKLLIKNKPHDKFTLITDSMRAKGMPDGVSELGGQTVIVKNGEARLTDGTLAGSVLKMNVAVKNLVEKVGVSISDAIDFATMNPAKNLGLESETGSIKIGKRANITVLDKNFDVLLTLKDGEIIYKS